MTHERRISIDAGGQVVQVEDTVAGRGQHCIESRIHLHPDVEVEAREADSIQLSCGEHRVRITVDQGKFQFDKGWHAPEFGKRKGTHVLVMQVSGELPVTCSYIVRY
ncbi:heparinase II/III domain-containing protein [Salinibacter ruber]|uniref:heparinase II/III domain-containing protein n=1 Tax=Salinibacter ruber TaxID=146919 RepID=UPI003C6DD212